MGQGSRWCDLEDLGAGTVGVPKRRVENLSEGLRVVTHDVRVSETGLTLLVEKKKGTTTSLFNLLKSYVFGSDLTPP